MAIVASPLAPTSMRAAPTPMATIVPHGPGCSTGASSGSRRKTPYRQRANSARPSASAPTSFSLNASPRNPSLPVQPDFRRAPPARRAPRAQRPESRCQPGCRQTLPERTNTSVAPVTVFEAPALSVVVVVKPQ